MGPKPIETFLGGPWQRVLLRLVIFCAIVGFVMATFGIEPEALWHNIAETVRRLVDAIAFQGLDTLVMFGRYCLYGAVIVIPIWLISRLFASRR
jgi:hypothetical protein